MKPPSRRRQLPARSSVAPFNRERGSVLFAVFILAVVMAGVLAGVITYVSQSVRIERRSNFRCEATYVADYAFEKAFESLNALVEQDYTALPNIAQTTAVTNLGTAPTGAFSAAQGYTWKSFLTVPLENGAITGAHTSFNPAKGSYKFLTVAEFDRTVPSLGAPVRTQFQREWGYVLTPLFQYAIFYNTDMELFPGASFVVGGRVHSNGRVHVGTSATIQFRDHVSQVNGITNNYHPLDPRAPGSPGAAITYDRGPAITTTREDPPGISTLNTSDSNTNNDGPRELIEISDYMHADPNAGSRLFTKSGLKVLVNTTGAGWAAASGHVVAANSRLFVTQDGTTVPGTDPLATYLNTMFAAGTMKDFRESATLTTIDLDVGKVTAGYMAGGLPQQIPSTNKWPNNSSVPAALKNQPIPVALRGKNLWNGILYVADITHGFGHRTAVRITNGSELPDGSKASSPQAGLTVVSQNAAYIVGNYNAGGSPPVNSGSDLAAANAVSGYTVQPAAVIADAVTIVSANWISSNYNGVSSFSSRTPVNTTINTAFISGIVPSDGANYSGGVENYMRLLEDWSGKRLTYYGSIINLFASAQATAPWQNTGVYYNAPGRNWYFDVNFLDPNKLPPGTPILRSLKRGQWVQIQ